MDKLNVAMIEWGKIKHEANKVEYLPESVFVFSVNRGCNGRRGIIQEFSVGSELCQELTEDVERKCIFFLYSRKNNS